MTDRRQPGLHEALTALRRSVPLLDEILRTEPGGGRSAWAAVIDRKLLPRTDPDFPLIATICGGGSSGKSTLFNTLAGESVSPTGGRAGLNRRVLIAAPAALADRGDHLGALFEPFGADPQPMTDPGQLLVPGTPLYMASDTIPAHLVLLDTPDFDTGARGVYTNRDAAAGALETADILIYIFTNSNYNNRDNTDFIADMLTGIGRRKCFLVYRVYPSFSVEEVLEHADTVARNLYGDTAGDNVLGIYRVDDDNEVAAGRRPMTIRPARPQDPPFAAALEALDHRRLRLELMASILDDVLAAARRSAQRALRSRQRLALYLEALQTARSQCVQEALQHFPLDRVMSRFAQIWLATDPPHIRAMRSTGKVLDLPVRGLVKAVRWARRKGADAPQPPPRQEAADRLSDDLLQAANRLHRHTLEETLALAVPPADPLARRLRQGDDDTRSAAHLEPSGEEGRLRAIVTAHPAAEPVRDTLRHADWKTVLEGILSHKDLLTSISGDIDRELSDLVSVFRAKMGFWEQTRQTFSAFLNVLPATVAVTYILSTGDPIGAAGIKVKLTGLFGLHDLYALVALPATTGLKQADLKQLERMTGPIAKTWLQSKLQAVESLFDRHITGSLIDHLQQTGETADRLLADIEKAIGECERAVAPV